MRGPVFDARSAHDGVAAVCRAVQAAPSTAAILEALQEAHAKRDTTRMRKMLASCPDDLFADIAGIVTTVHDSFSVRVIRAPLCR